MKTIFVLTKIFGILLLYIITIIIFILSILKYNKKRNITVLVLSLILQLFLGIIIVLVFEQSNTPFFHISFILNLILNTITLLISTIKLLRNNKNKIAKIIFTIISVIAIILGILFSFGYTTELISNLKVGYDNNVREIARTIDCEIEDAKELNDNIQKALSTYDNDITIYGLYEEEKENTYGINYYDSNYGQPAPNGMYIELEENGLDIKRVYWQFNDEIQIPFYENDSKVNNYSYIVTSSIYTNEPIDYLKEEIEEEIKDKLKSPSSAIFTYKGIQYNRNNNTFQYTGYVESQNSFSAMIRTDFVIKVTPCTEEKCDLGIYNYTWNFEQ